MVRLAAIFTIFFLFSCTENKPRAMYKTKAPVLSEKEIIEQKNVALRDSVVQYAYQFMGTKYCYAAADPAVGFDCSGFVNYVYKHFDIELPRSSAGFKDIGTAKKAADFKKGDILVFYGYQDAASIGHLGIVYKANGMKSTFIHASSGSEMAVTISQLGSDMYTRRFYKCIDPFAL